MAELEPTTYLGRVIEGTSKSFTFTIAHNGTGFQPEALFLSIWDKETGAVILAETALTPIGTYVTGAGVATIFLSTAHNALVNTYLRKETEIHRVMARWTWTSSAGAEAGKAMFDIKVDPHVTEPGG